MLFETHSCLAYRISNGPQGHVSRVMPFVIGLFIISVGGFCFVCLFLNMFVRSCAVMCYWARHLSSQKDSHGNSSIEAWRRTQTCVHSTLARTNCFRVSICADPILTSHNQGDDISTATAGQDRQTRTTRNSFSPKHSQAGEWRGGGP
jgi:hypothetical protein